MNLDKGFGIKMSEWLQQSIDENPIVLLNKNNALTKSVFLWSLLSQNPFVSRTEEAETKYHRAGRTMGSGGA